MEEEIIKIISKAISNKDITIETNSENLEEWDSLGHLTILSALDKASGGKINKISEFNDVKSIKEIISLCKLHNLEF